MAATPTKRSTLPTTPEPTRSEIEYTVAIASSASSIESIVRNLLTQGWELVGGASVVLHGAHLQFHQAMTRKPK